MKSFSNRTVVVVGKIGHGKTALLNKICDTNYVSEMSMNSCTKKLQHGSTTKYGITVIDTPGFYSSEDVENHISVQKQALEGTYISGIYIVVKIGRAADMADTLNRIMDFVGIEDVRIIVTHSDTIENGDDIPDLKHQLCKLLGVPVEQMAVVGKDTTGDELELFIKDTLHEPITLNVSKEQHAFATTFCVGARKFEQYVTTVSDEIDVLDTLCKQFITEKQTVNDVTKDIALYAVLRASELVASRGISDIIKASSELIPEQKKILHDSINSSIVSKQKQIEQLCQDNCSVFSIRRGLQDFLKRVLFKIELEEDSSMWTISYELDGIDVVPLVSAMEGLRKLSKAFISHVNRFYVKPRQIRTFAASKRSMDYAPGIGNEVSSKRQVRDNGRQHDLHQSNRGSHGHVSAKYSKDQVDGTSSSCALKKQPNNDDTRDVRVSTVSSEERNDARSLAQFDNNENKPNMRHGSTGKTLDCNIEPVVDKNKSSTLAAAVYSLRRMTCCKIFSSSKPMMRKKDKRSSKTKQE